MTKDKININDLINIGDLMFFDGPLMSLFTDKQKTHFFILDWVDANEQFNKWIAYQVPLSALSTFIEGKLSHRDLLRHSLRNEFSFIEIDDNLQYYLRSTLSFKELPESYLPKENTYFLLKNCPDFRDIQKHIPSIRRKNTLKELEPVA
jgi:hypothetical protein